MAHSDAIPRHGLGTYGRTGAKGTAAMLKAIEIGYRHLDTAQTYDTEATVGEAVRRSGLPRDDFFITIRSRSILICRLRDSVLTPRRLV